VDGEAIGPILVRPRLDPKPWGGRRLEEYGIALPPNEPIGEAIYTAMDATVVAGRFAGYSLGQLVLPNPAAFIGTLGLEATGDRPLYPLLIKLIDAEENLSIQVHPDNAQAALLGDRLGKTECWHILAVDPGAAIYLGLRPDVTLPAFEHACRTTPDDVASLLRRIPVSPGMTILTPAGTVHAIGAGVVLYELQQPSDITYRLNDWGRLDAQGRPRQLHLDQGFAAIKPELRPDPIAPIALPAQAGRRQILVACRFFALERVALAAGEILPITELGAPQAITCLQGRIELSVDHIGGVVHAGETSLAPARAAGVRLAAGAPTVALRAWVPDLYRDIVVPARNAGASDDAIAALAGPLPDLRKAEA